MRTGVLHHTSAMSRGAAKDLGDEEKARPTRLNSGSVNAELVVAVCETIQIGF